MVKFITPSEQALESRYEALTNKQKQFFEYLVEKRDYYIKQALEIAENVKEYERARCEPRLEEIVGHMEYDSISDIIDLKNCIKRYRKALSWTQRALVWFRVTHNSETFKEALNNVIRNDDSVELTGYFVDEKYFGEYICYECEYLSNFTFSDIYEFFISNRYKESCIDDLPKINEMIDYTKIAYHALWGWYGGGGLSKYDRAEDPEVPYQWGFFKYN